MKKLFFASIIAILAMASCTSPSGRISDAMVFIPYEDVLAVSFVDITATQDQIVITGKVGDGLFRAKTSNYARAFSVNEWEIDSLGGKHDKQVGYFIRSGDMVWTLPAKTTDNKISAR